MKKLILAACIGGVMLPVYQAFAYPVEVMTSMPITTEVVPQLSAANGTLGSILSTNQQIGGAVSAGNDKIAAMIQQSTENMQKYATYAQQVQNLETARRSYTVPESICSESASGQASQIARQAGAKQNSLASGGGVSNAAIKKALSSKPDAPEKHLFATADIHRNYCTKEDADAWGDLCNGVSDLPGGDKQIRSLLAGAGPEDKAPELTFSQEQTDAAMMYLKNSSRRSVGRALKKGEVKTDSGRQYIGMMTEHDSIQSAAEQPQLSMVAASQPNEATKDVLAETLQTPSSKAWYDANASEEAKRTGMMSLREFESFEVNRRYANTDYQTDLQGMDGDNLVRESIRVQSLQNALLLGIKQQLHENAILSGQQLSLQGAQYYEPRLAEKLQQAAAGATRQ
ncbi:conjugal transfer protein (plasmid) [Pectobacterium parmentieri]|uniref:conjugal transfer protein TraW n=1 Tax=Pectobacterium parmentieri TaxID=1905730 RepID=UPI000F8E053C|nr:conjugal transfer protein TraW [Pectobacterium parmentieri]AZS59257.1 conjugal transfer protein [Pectobacterium parmentieri]